MKISKNTIQSIANKAFNEVLNELREAAPRDNFSGYTDNWSPEPNGGLGNPEIPDTAQSVNRDNQLDKQFKPSRSGNKLANNAAKLAQLKGELATILDKAERSGTISRDKAGKIRIIRLPEYQKMIGNLPQQIKILQQSVLENNNPRNPNK
jgi:hypothetical protein